MQSCPHCTARDCFCPPDSVFSSKEPRDATTEGRRPREELLSLFFKFYLKSRISDHFMLSFAREEVKMSEALKSIRLYGAPNAQKRNALLELQKNYTDGINTFIGLLWDEDSLWKDIF